MIQLRSITRIYKMGSEQIHALDNVDLEITKGEFVAIIGPSGSGKTTLANIIGGLDTPSSGDVSVENEKIKNLSDRQLSRFRNKKIGFVFQTFNLQPGYTAMENVMVPLVFSKVPARARKAKSIECLEAVGLAGRMKHRPNQLSGGERQRVSIARAIVNDPEIIIADEPTGNLDTEKGQEILDLLKKLNQTKKITLIIITHDPRVAEQADRIISLQDGKLVPVKAGAA